MLFTLLAERDERKSVLVTTNLVFSEWERIFKDPMTTLQPAARIAALHVHRELSAQEKALNGAAWAQGHQREPQHSSRNGCRLISVAASVQPRDCYLAGDRPPSARSNPSGLIRLD